MKVQFCVEWSASEIWQSRRHVAFKARCSSRCHMSLSTQPIVAPSNANSVRPTNAENVSRRASRETSNSGVGPFCPPAVSAKLILTSRGAMRCLCQRSHLGCNLGTLAALCAQRWAAWSSKGYSVADLSGKQCLSRWQRLESNPTLFFYFFYQCGQTMWTASRPWEIIRFVHKICAFCFLSVCLHLAVALLLLHTRTHSIQPKLVSGCWKCQTALSRPI